MSRTTAVAVLFLAAVLEAGGDALVRHGLQASSTTLRLALFALGAVVLLSYGYVVNRPPWDFGKLLGVYVVCFFVVAQAISWLVFDQRPSGVTLLGGAFIIAGGVIISLG